MEFTILNAITLASYSNDSVDSSSHVTRSLSPSDLTNSHITNTFRYKDLTHKKTTLRERADREMWCGLHQFSVLSQHQGRLELTLCQQSRGRVRNRTATTTTLGSRAENGKRWLECESSPKGYTRRRVEKSDESQSGLSEGSICVVVRGVHFKHSHSNTPNTNTKHRYNETNKELVFSKVRYSEEAALRVSELPDLILAKSNRKVRYYEVTVPMTPAEKMSEYICEEEIDDDDMSMTSNSSTVGCLSVAMASPKFALTSLPGYGDPQNTQ